MPHRRREGLIAVGGDHERPRPADDLIPERRFEIIADRAAIAEPAEDGEAVDGHPFIDGGGAALGDGGAVPVVGAVAGEVDHPAGAVDIVGFDHPRGGHQRGADGVAAIGPARGGHQLIAERRRRLRPVDHGPLGHDFLAVGAGPFDIGERHPAIISLGHRPHQIRVFQRVSVALALKQDLGVVDRAAGVGEQDQFEVSFHGRGLGGGGEGEQGGGQGGGQGNGQGNGPDGRQTPQPVAEETRLHRGHDHL